MDSVRFRYRVRLKNTEKIGVRYRVKLGSGLW